MKFNEKLIELRKKEGLSQEELGYKLNVTRQTVSKWELGQTTPEMDKLVEMGKIFNITVDELINESEIKSEQNPEIEDQPIIEEGTKKNKVLIVIVIAFIVVIVLIISKIFSGFNAIKNERPGISNEQAGLFERIFEIFDRVLDVQENMIDNMNFEENTLVDSNLNQNTIGEAMNKIDTESFNGKLELYQGSNNGIILKKVFDEVSTKNKTEERKITVNYKKIETQNAEEIKDLKKGIKDIENFEISFEYDEQGYINEVKVERIFTQIEIDRFNNLFEMYSGTKMGGHVITLLDYIITSNKTEERKITVKYNDTETLEETEIKNIKRNIGTFDNYDITLEYDAEGFINKATIEKF